MHRCPSERLKSAARVPSGRRWLFRALAGWICLLSSGPARAHTAGISRGDYRVDGAEVVAALTFSRAELALFVPALGSDEPTRDLGRDPHVRQALDAWTQGAVRVRAGGGACRGELQRLEASESDGLTLWVHYACPADAAELEIDDDFVGSLSAGHRHLGHLSFAQSSIDFIAKRGATNFRVDVPKSEGTAAPARAPARATPLARFRAMFSMGIEHILSGYDHLLFLVGLLLVLGPVRSLVFAITAFTVAHSISLGASTLGFATPSPAVVEPLIAISIVYIGIENWFVKDAVGRWRVTFLFGLVHGFGFAGALREISLPRPEVPLALFSFNLGVEAGQLAVVAAVLPLLLLARRRGWLEAKTTRLLSVPVAAMGLIWFISRIAVGA